jgi:hypothetical protein
MAGRLRETLRVATEEAGTAVHAEGAPMSKDLWLRGMEKVELNFDRTTGLPDHVLWAGQPMIDAMGKAWEAWGQDREFMRKYKQILAQKYEDWRDRESRRKLVD